MADGFPSLYRRLRLEPLLGAGVLLCVALMSQVAPAVTVFSSGAHPAGSQAPGIPLPTPGVGAAPASITGSTTKGSLAVTLTVDPAAVGQVRLFAVVRERGGLLPTRRCG